MTAQRPSSSVMVIDRRDTTVHASLFRPDEPRTELVGYARATLHPGLDLPLAIADLWGALPVTPDTRLILVTDLDDALIVDTEPSDHAAETAQAAADRSLHAQVMAPCGPTTHIAPVPHLERLVRAADAAGLEIDHISLATPAAARTRARRRTRNPFDDCHVPADLLTTCNLTPDELAASVTVALEHFRGASVGNLHPAHAPTVHPRGLGTNDGWAIAPATSPVTAPTPPAEPATRTWRRRTPTTRPARASWQSDAAPADEPTSAAPGATR